MDIVVWAGALANASSPENRNKGILLDVAHADPQAQIHLFAERTATQPPMEQQPKPPRREESVSTTNARPRHVSFDERSFKLTTLAVESFGYLGEEGYTFIDELATHAAGGRDGGSMAKKEVFKE